MPLHCGSLSKRRVADPGRDDRPEPGRDDRPCDDSPDDADEGRDEGTTGGAGSSPPVVSVCAQCPRGFTSSEPCRLPASGGRPDNVAGAESLALAPLRIPPPPATFT
jgi:hypothetical protein